MTKTLKIYYLDENYINYLRLFDTKVAYNKNQTRPYIGVVYSFKLIMLREICTLVSKMRNHLTFLCKKLLTDKYLYDIF